MDLSGYNAWGIVSVVAVLLVALILANMMKRRIPFIKKSLIPTSVLAGAIILVVSSIYTIATKGDYLFELEFFGSPSKAALEAAEAGLISKEDLSQTGLELLEIITYHALALGFIATTFKPTQEKLSKKRSTEVFNAGVSTVSTYLLQAIIGIAVTMIACLFIPGLTNYAGIILCFGFGQGTGQALNFGNIYETINNSNPNADNYIEGAKALVNGADFGLSIASLGFISAAIGGVIYLNVTRRRMRKKFKDADLGETMTLDKVQTSEELPMESSGVDKITMQLAFILGSYFIAYGLLYLLGKLVPGMKSTIYGFNFLIGVLVATIVGFVLRFLKKKKLMKHEYINPFLMKRIAGFFFDIMIIAGMAAIRPDTLGKYWHVLLVMALLGATATFFYLKFISKKLFFKYRHEQFLATYGMLTGTASTGIILLREWDPKFKTPAADNLVYQNFPAIVFGLPIMLLASAKVIAVRPVLTFIIFILLFIAMNLILFRSFIFKKRKKKVTSEIPSAIEGEGDEVDTAEIDLGTETAE
jgi:ESS family glutamate:Na+ symporter